VRLLSANRIRRLVVIDETGACRGVVAQADVVRHASSDATAHLLQEVSQPAVSGATVPETVGLHRGNPALDL
jgi:CBS domain-containing protein